MEVHPPSSLPIYWLWCIKFLIKPLKISPNDDLENNVAEDILDLFEYRIKTKIIKGKEAYLLHELLNDIKYLSVQQDPENSAIKHISSLKQYLIREYLNDTVCFPSEKYPFGRTIGIKPSKYSIAKLHVCMLRDADPTKAFGRI